LIYLHHSQAIFNEALLAQIRCAAVALSAHQGKRCRSLRHFRISLQFRNGGSSVGFSVGKEFLNWVMKSALIWR